MKLDKCIYIVGDLGHLKVYKVVDTLAESRHETMQVSHINNKGVQKKATSLKKVMELDYILPRKNEQELQSDQMGRFLSGSTASTGEEHNLKIERDQKTLELIAQDIKKVIAKERPSVWYLSFSKKMYGKLNGMLDEDIKKTLKKTLPLNLTKTPKDELLSHFA
ncbi:MAG: host attachment protein [Sulfurospirillaceae bacterium]|nr:host attachment protein [Sulfurospirillaceae bacterium]